MSGSSDDSMKDFIFIAPPQGADYDQSELDELMEKIQPLQEDYAGCAICTKDIAKNTEHLPPKSSGNVTPLDTITIDVEQSRRGKELAFTRGQSVPFRYRESLCPKCNNSTGVWYASDYRDFVAIAEKAVVTAEDNSTAEFTFAGRPSAVVKQVLSFMCSVCGPSLPRNAPVVQELLLKNKFRATPAEFRLWAYLTNTPGGKETGFTITYGKDQGHKHIVAEFSHRPLGWVLSWQSPPVPGLTEVTHWLDLEYKRIEDFEVRLPKLPSSSPFPLDYRADEEL